MSASQRHEIASRGGQASHGGGRGRSSGGGQSSGTSRRGFASMDPERRREISAEGGRHSHGGWGRDYEPRGGRSRYEQDYNQDDRNSRRGFASMDPERRREISAEGGRQSHGGWGRDYEPRSQSRYGEEEDDRNNYRDEESEGGGRSRRGFASMDPERRREIGAEGGRHSHGDYGRYEDEGDYEEEDWRGQGGDEEEDDAYENESDYDQEDDNGEDEYEYRGRGRSYEDEDRGGPRRGFASWAPEDRRRAASRGGRASHSNR